MIGGVGVSSCAKNSSLKPNSQKKASEINCQYSSTVYYSTKIIQKIITVFPSKQSTIEKQMEITDQNLPLKNNNLLTEALSLSLSLSLSLPLLALDQIYRKR
ncbi:hypothetical protein CIPAW_11G174900 [Carya illinoinensis]|uniref:Uncharacterized protein n=1 Tax=Carya illinoinensis TaxID=32201 RepID=A0A8T1P0M9_CARIL|nr:hypothetical protein CIPAW_11G174900 [Carya illinoinensis]